MASEGRVLRGRSDLKAFSRPLVEAHSGSHTALVASVVHAVA